MKNGKPKQPAQVYGKDTIQVDDPWTTLGVDDSASLKEVKVAYRDIMRKVHPDSSKLSRLDFRQNQSSLRTALRRIRRRVINQPQLPKNNAQKEKKRPGNQ